MSFRCVSFHCLQWAWATKYLGVASSMSKHRLNLLFKLLFSFPHLYSLICVAGGARQCKSTLFTYIEGSHVCRDYQVFLLLMTPRNAFEYEPIWLIFHSNKFALGNQDSRASSKTQRWVYSPVRRCSVCRGEEERTEREFLLVWIMDIYFFDFMSSLDLFQWFFRMIWPTDAKLGMMWLTCLAFLIDFSRNYLISLNLLKGARGSTAADVAAAPARSAMWLGPFPRSKLNQVFYLWRTYWCVGWKWCLHCVGILSITNQPKENVVNQESLAEKFCTVVKTLICLSFFEFIIKFFDMYVQFWRRHAECPLKGRDTILRSICTQLYGLVWTYTHMIHTQTYTKVKKKNRVQKDWGISVILASTVCEFCHSCCNFNRYLSRDSLNSNHFNLPF